MTKPTPDHPAAIRYRAADMLRMPAGSGFEAVVRRDGQAPIVVMHAQVAAVLASCRRFEPLSEHRDRICRTGWGCTVDRAHVEQLLSALCEAGLLTPMSALVAAARSQRNAEGACTIETMGWVTRDRPASLARSLETYLGNAATHGRRVRCVVADDSREDTQHSIREIVARTAGRHGFDWTYIGAAAKAALAAVLTERAGVREAVVQFALGDTLRCGSSIGANRNALLLETSGSPVVSADDDTECRLAVSPDHDPIGVATCDTLDPTEVWPLPDRLAARNLASGNHDLLGWHERALGRGLGGLVADAAARDALRLEDVSPELAGMLRAGRGRVRITFTGVVGDSGMPSHSGLLWGLTGPSRARVLASEHACRAALEGRNLVRVAPCLTLAASSQCMSTSFGLDNRCLLPPFPPAGRNEDAAFGAILAHIADDNVFAHLPVAAFHDAEPRQNPPGVVSPLTVRHLSDLLMFCVMSCAPLPVGQPPPVRLARLGRHLQMLAALPLDDFRQFLHEQLVIQAAAFFQTVDWTRQAHGGEPAYWARLLDDCCAEAREAMQSDDVIVPVEFLRAGLPAEEALDRARSFIGLYGELLEGWPALVDAAARSAPGVTRGRL